MSTQNTKPATNVTTGKVRLSYVHVFEPSAVNDGEEEKYSLSILIPKKDKVTIAKIEAAVKAAAEQGKTSKFGGKIPANLKTPLRDGDTEKEDDEAYKGMMFLNASSKRKPKVVDVNIDEIIDKDEVYSGVYGRVSLNFYPYDAKGNRGIAAGLNNVQKLEDGERLGGGASSAADDFGGDFADDLM